jgi:hypothetical protein
MTNTVEVSNPSWVSQESAYVFSFTQAPTIEGSPTPRDTSDTLPDLSRQTSLIETVLTGFLEKTKQLFVTPLQLEKIKKYLTHHIAQKATFPTEEGFYKPVWAPVTLKMKSNEFALYWSVTKWVSSEVKIPSDFFRPQTPTPPELQPNLRTIQIQNTMDSLIPVGDLPLSDLPPLNFGDETPEKREVRRRIREARLKVELAKLKAKRMEQKYYERYGEAATESEESSLESSETDSDEPMGKYSYP